MKNYYNIVSQIITYQLADVDVQAYADDQLVIITVPSGKRISAAWKARVSSELEQKTTVVFEAAGRKRITESTTKWQE